MPAESLSSGIEYSSSSYSFGLGLFRFNILLVALFRYLSTSCIGLKFGAPASLVFLRFTLSPPDNPPPERCFSPIKLPDIEMSFGNVIISGDSKFELSFFYFYIELLASVREGTFFTKIELTCSGCQPLRDTYPLVVNVCKVPSFR